MSKNSTLILAIIGTAAVLSGCATVGDKAVEQNDVAQVQKIVDTPGHNGEDLENLLDDSIVYDNCLECARILFKAGAKGTKNLYGRKTAGGDIVMLDGLDGRLAWAALYGREKMAELLIQQGAEPTAALANIRDHNDPPIVQGAKEFFAKVEADMAAKAAAPAPAANEAKPAPAAESGKQWWGK